MDSKQSQHLYDRTMILVESGMVLIDDAYQVLAEADAHLRRTPLAKQKTGAVGQGTGQGQRPIGSKI